MGLITASATDLARRHFAAMETGDSSLAQTAIHPDHVNHESPDHPPASSRQGVAGFLATSAWLRSAFDGLHFAVEDLVSDGHLTIAHVTMTGRQEGPFVVFPPGAAPVSFPPTGKQFSVRQCHLFTIKDGLHLTHQAVRDDLGMLTQLGHLPPSPAALIRMVRWRASGGHRRAVHAATALAAEAADAWPR